MVGERWEGVYLRVGCCGGRGTGSSGGSSSCHLLMREWAHPRRYYRRCRGQRGHHWSWSVDHPGGLLRGAGGFGVGGVGREFRPVAGVEHVLEGPRAHRRQALLVLLVHHARGHALLRRLHLRCPQDVDHGPRRATREIRRAVVFPRPRLHIHTQGCDDNKNKAWRTGKKGQIVARTWPSRNW